MDKLEWNKVREHVAIHVPCSSKKLGVENTFAKIAGLCAEQVTPSGVACCGMAGDRGMLPGLTGSSLSYLDSVVLGRLLHVAHVRNVAVEPLGRCAVRGLVLGG